MSVSEPEIDQLLGQVDSKFTLCILSSKRARQINDMIHGVRDQALQAMATSEIAKLTSAKPLSLAMDEIADGDVLPDELRTTEEDDVVAPAAAVEAVEEESAAEPAPAAAAAPSDEAQAAQGSESEVLLG